MLMLSEMLAKHTHSLLSNLFWRQYHRQLQPGHIQNILVLLIRVDGTTVVCTTQNPRRTGLAL